MRRILVTSRGAMARRLIRSIHEAGLQAVAVGSLPEAEAPHMREADAMVLFRDAWFDGESVDVRRVLAAAVESRCDAVHPGSGPLAEDHRFAREVMASGLLWVGADPDVIAVTRDRAQTRLLVARMGIPVIPGTPDLEDDGEFLRWADRNGFPVILKSALATRLPALLRVERMEDLPLSLTEARRRARRATGQGRIYMERMVARARHVEVQVVADRAGNQFVVGDREGSVQRNFVPVVEEAPVARLNLGLREDLQRAALALNSRLQAHGLTSYEFLVTADGRFYFVEINTRLQDSHGVTESVHGVDLVDAQLRVAAGERLGWNPADLQPDGHGISFRVHAEDPTRGFQPSSGVVTDLELPEGVRVDCGVRRGSRVVLGDDTLLLRVVVRAPSRQAAIVRARAALKETRVAGLQTNLDLLERITASEAFWRGEVDVEFLHREFWV